MSTYTSKTKVHESKQQFLEESSKQKRQTLLTIILIFFLILLLLFSVLISNKFTITSMDVRKSDKKVDFAYYDLGKTNGEIKTEKTIENVSQEKPITTTPIVEQKPAEKQVTPIKQETSYQAPPAPTYQVTASEKKVGIDGKIITSQNIKTYHSLLLKEFEGKDIESYKIIWGDTLWKIALKFNTSAHTLYVLNALDNPDLIIAGKNLKIVRNFVLPKERTEKILEDAIKGKTGFNSKSDESINKLNIYCYAFYEFFNFVIENNEKIIYKNA